MKFRFILLWTRSSSEFCSPPLSTVRSVSDRNRPFLQFRRPSTAFPVRPHSCHELSKLTTGPLSGFLNLSAVSALTEFHGLVSCRNRSWTASLQSVPLAKIVNPSRGHLAPLQLSTVLRNAPPATLSPAVSPTPTLLTQLPGSPTNYGFPFHGSEGPLPGLPGSPTEGSSLPPASPASKLYSLHESVRTDPSFPEFSGRYSPGLVPLSRPNRPNLGASYPPEPLRTHARTLSRRIRSATPGTESTPG